MKQEDIQNVSSAAKMALADLKTKKGLPLNGYIVFPYMYMSRKCHYMSCKLSHEYKSLTYKYAGVIALFGGPHMLYVFKGMPPWLVDAAFSIQVVMFILYFIMRHKLITQSRTIQLDFLPLRVYTHYLTLYMKTGIMIKLLILFILFFALAAGFFTYSVFINGYYFLFMFMFGALLWLSAGALILSITLFKKIAGK